MSLLVAIIEYFLKLSKLSVLALIVWIFYVVLVRPLYMKWYYSRYPNLFLRPGWKPLIGNFTTIFKYQAEGKCFLQHYKDASVGYDYDLQLIFGGSEPIFKVSSIKAMKEVIKLIPAKIDRGPGLKRFEGKMSKGFEIIRSGHDWKNRRFSIMKER